jgi:LytS/YehU family sensor histidine kinase
LPRALAASVVLAGLSLCALVLGFHRAREEPFVWSALFGTVANFRALFLGWQLFYFGYHTLDRARRAEAERWRLAAAVQGAELRFLESQLNRHFLFNCLNSLGALVAEDPERAQEALGRLASLLRHALAAGLSETASLGEELTVVRDRLALEGIRYELRLTARVEVGEACLQARVPVMLLQSLVENGVKHGIAKQPGGGEIAVLGRLQDGIVRLEVRNPIPPAGVGVAGEGIGLANACERLRLLFGDRAAVGVAPTDGLMVAWVELPG